MYQAEQLDKLGMEVIEVDLRDAYAFGGGLHCCTADVYREGEIVRIIFPNNKLTIYWVHNIQTASNGESPDFIACQILGGLWIVSPELR